MVNFNFCFSCFAFFNIFTLFYFVPFHYASKGKITMAEPLSLNKCWWMNPLHLNLSTSDNIQDIQTTLGFYRKFESVHLMRISSLPQPGRRCLSRQTQTVWIKALAWTCYQSLPSQQRVKETRPRASVTPARLPSPSESSRRTSMTPPLQAAPTVEPRSLVWNLNCV